MRIMINSIVLAIVLALALASTASAQRAPDMATLDRGDGISKIGIDLGFSSIDTPFYDAALRLELAGQYVMRSGLGFYGALPITKSFGDAPAPMPQPTFALGNLELGGLYTITKSPRFSYVFRLGLAVPTASDDVDGSATNTYGTMPRLTDLALTIPNAWYLRLGFSPLIYVDKLFFRFDVGFDIGSDDDDLADELVRVNLGGGYDFGPVALSLELVNIYDLDDYDDNDDWVHTLALTFRFMLAQYQPFVSIGAPVDDVRDVIPFFIAAGFQVAP
jgi:hypothetical protein